MVEVIWTEPALENLNDIAEYIHLSNPLAASRLVENVFNSIQRLELFPESGRTPKELEELNYREVVVNPCRVFYKIDAGSVYILHVLRQERDLRRYLLATEENT